MPLPPLDLDRIRRLRDLFLAAHDDDAAAGRRARPALLRDYWRDRRDVEAYDAVLGARIGWKWDAALAECAARGFAPPSGARVLDFGCGAGVAARRFVARFGAAEVLCHDRSPHAMAFAVDRLRDEAPAVRAEACANVDDVAPDVLLVSHVLGELDARGEAGLRALVARSRRVLIVEPGNRPVARRLSALRDDVVRDGGDDRLRVVAPCPHEAPCPALASDDDWCHFFASPPGDVFVDGDWVKAARALGIDLRSLPYAFVALSREPASAEEPPPTRRALGRARVQKHAAVVQLCTERGIEAHTVEKRADADGWRRLKKHPERLDHLER